jgi:hypothetical protein
MISRPYHHCMECERTAIANTYIMVVNLVEVSSFRCFAFLLTNNQCSYVGSEYISRAKHINQIPCGEISLCTVYCPLKTCVSEAVSFFCLKVERKGTYLFWDP